MDHTLTYTFAEGSLGCCILAVDERTNNFVYVNLRKDTTELLDRMAKTFAIQSRRLKIHYILKEDLGNKLIHQKATIESLLDGKKVKKVDFQYLYGTEFQRKVWDELNKVPWGCTTTYQRVAKNIGTPHSYRAVANACGANPLPLIIPCHRVLASNGTLGGFACGLDLKQQLLASEETFLKKSSSGVTSPSGCERE
ncbi:LAME_0H00232g1_1 [Lachancea meyersii CBS 8951]|uniref:Methylated-DNA--protein-cysteine methyltransferase n=1 Tax=Lachancea meyersii CBS 8951 TaxID=1266667 RepID=A0A1G4KDF6_9SACH|nr:LAME_0H00232g1_1 [Lachancea meyersii CBS 8951]